MTMTRILTTLLLALPLIAGAGQRDRQQTEDSALAALLASLPPPLFELRQATRNERCIF